MNKGLLFFVCILIINFHLKSQDDGDAESVQKLLKVDYETPLTIDLDTASEADPVKKEEVNEKINSKIYYGIKCKKGFTRKGFGRKATYELFFYLKKKDYFEPGPYEVDFYYYDFEKRKIVNSNKIKNPKKVGIMHGHYVKQREGKTIEEGYYYKGKKHFRWVQYNSKDLLMDKEFYWKGWSKESLMAFYDSEKKVFKEVIPIQLGTKKGDYYAFHPNGIVACKGQYIFNRKYGVWKEYYPNGKPKREIEYPEDPLEDEAEAYISKEWDEKGKLIFNNIKNKNTVL